MQHLGELESFERDAVRNQDGIRPSREVPRSVQNRREDAQERQAICVGARFVVVSSRIVSKRLPDVDYQNIKVDFELIVEPGKGGRNPPIVTIPTSFVYSNIHDKCKVEVPITAEMLCAEAIVLKVVIRDVASVRLFPVTHSFMARDWELTREPSAPPIGIFNAGATCYLNSLIQSLFFITEFRCLLNSIPTRAHLSQCIASQSFSALQQTLQSSTFALQKVFHLLQCSREPLDISFLMDSFGWNAEEVNQQVRLGGGCDRSTTCTRCWFC